MLALTIIETNLFLENTNFYYLIFSWNTTTYVLIISYADVNMTTILFHYGIINITRILK